MANIMGIAYKISALTGVTTNTLPHYYPKNDGMFYHFTKYQEILDI